MERSAANKLPHESATTLQNEKTPKYCAKIGIKYFSRIFFVAYGRNPQKPHFHGQMDQQRTNDTVSKRRMQKKTVKIFEHLIYLRKTQRGQNTAGNSLSFLKESTLCNI